MEAKERLELTIEAMRSLQEALITLDDEIQTQLPAKDAMTPPYGTVLVSFRVASIHNLQNIYKMLAEYEKSLEDMDRNYP